MPRPRRRGCGPARAPGRRRGRRRGTRRRAGRGRGGGRRRRRPRRPGRRSRRRASAARPPPRRSSPVGRGWRTCGRWAAYRPLKHGGREGAHGKAETAGAVAAGRRSGRPGCLEFRYGPAARRCDRRGRAQPARRRLPARARLGDPDRPAHRLRHVRLRPDPRPGAHEPARRPRRERRSGPGRAPVGRGGPARLAGLRHRPGRRRPGDRPRQRPGHHDGDRPGGPGRPHRPRPRPRDRGGSP